MKSEECQPRHSRQTIVGDVQVVGMSFVLNIQNVLVVNNPMIHV